MPDTNSKTDNTVDEAKPAKKSMTLRLSPAAYEVLEEISNEFGISINEAVRRSLGTEQFFLQAKKRGERVLLQDKNDDLKEVVLR